MDNKKRRALSAQARPVVGDRPVQNGRSSVQGVVRSSSRRSPAAVSSPRRAPAPPIRQTTPRQKSSSAIPSMDKISMLIMEANEISQLLNKDYVFSKGPDLPGDDEIATVKVTNHKYAISCMWTLHKLKERLVKMRKLMYAGDSAGGGISSESVFYDRADVWARDSDSENIDSNNLKGTGTLEAALEAMAKEKNDQSGASILAREPPGRGPADGHSSPGIDETSHAPVADVLNAYEEIGNQTNGESPRPATRSRSATPQLRLSRESRDRSAPRLTDGSTPELCDAASTHATAPARKDLNGTNDSMLSTGSSELPAESEFILASTMSESNALVLPERFLTSTGNTKEIPSSIQMSSRRFAERSGRTPQKSRLQPKKAYPRGADKVMSQTIAFATVTTQTEAEEVSKPASIISLCKDMLKVISDRTKGQQKSESLLDRILCSCESIKVGVINILEAFVQAKDSGNRMSDFGDSEVMRITSMQLVASLELLVSHTNLWAASLNDNKLSIIGGLNKNIQSIVQEMAGELVAFLQGCENDLETLAHDCSTKIIDLLFTLVKNCGELSVATETQTSCLEDPERETLEELISLKCHGEEDLIKVKPSVDLKQSFLSGSDQFLDDTFQASLHSVECCESKIQSLAEECHKHPNSSEADEVLKHVYITLATSKILVLKTQEVQVELDESMKDDYGKPENYFDHYYQRCLCLLSQLNPLVDSLTLLTQASEPLALGSDVGAMRKVCRCTEMIQRSAIKLLQASESSHFSPSSSVSSSSSSDPNGGMNGLAQRHNVLSKDGGILRSSHRSHLTRAGNDVALATQTLIDMLRKRLPSLEDAGAKSKRMLPATPRASAARPITPKSFLPQPGSRAPLLRAKSASQQNRNRLVRNSWHTFDAHTGFSDV